MSIINIIDLSVIGDKRGSLISLEQCRNVPFEIKRVYYMYGMDSQLPRGFHAHKRLRQLAVCVNGSCEVLIDNGNSQEVVRLNDPSKGLLIEPYQWHVMQSFTRDCILMVLADDYYNESDYIRNYDDFLRNLQ